MKEILITPIVVLGLLAMTSQVLAAEPALREKEGFSLEVATGIVGIDQFEETQAALAINPRWCRGRNQPWCWWIDIWWIDGPWPDPWGGDLVIDDTRVPVSDLDVGPALMIAPAIEYRFQPENRLTPSLYFGLGLQWEDGNTTNISGVGKFSTDSTTSPVAIFGGALTYDLTSTTALRFAAGGSLVFMGDMDIDGPGGTNFDVDGDEVLNGIVSVGLEFAL